MGVDLCRSRRVASLTSGELHTLAGRMNDMPAGGDALAIIGTAPRAADSRSRRDRHLQEIS
jgi:hypothetical protein